MLIGLADDEIGYIIPKAEWDEKPPYLQNAPKAWYGEENSVGPGCRRAHCRRHQGDDPMRRRARYAVFYNSG